MEVAAQLGIRAVPAVIFDGTLLARPPDSLNMVNLVRAALLGNESPDPASGTPKEGTHR
jgi:hypothetical protein